MHLGPGESGNVFAMLFSSHAMNGHNRPPPLTILCLVLLSSYSYSKEISSEQLVERQGLKYEINSTIPFTGSVTHSRFFGWTSKRINYKDGKLDGVWEDYYDDIPEEVLQQRSNWRNGVRHGATETYTLNILTNTGVLTERKNYKNGKLNGLYETYSFEECGISSSQICSDSNSSLLKEKRNYKDGKEEGLYEYFHENGQLQVRGNLKDGIKEGVWEFFHENGELLRTETYKEGVLKSRYENG